MADAKVFRMGGNQTLEDVAHALEDFLRTQKHLETEGVAQSETSYFIQARQTEGWKKFVGMDQAIQVRLSVYGGILTVDLGAGRWVDKLGAATLGYIIFSPLLLTAAIGAIGQQRPRKYSISSSAIPSWASPWTSTTSRRRPRKRRRSRPLSARPAARPCRRERNSAPAAESLPPRSGCARCAARLRRWRGRGSALNAARR